VSLAQLQPDAAAIAELVERPDHGCDLAALLDQLGLADVVAALDERGAASARAGQSRCRRR